MNVPRKINMGSGKDFKEHHLNIDINDYWSPDIVLDLSTPIKQSQEFETKRFGVTTVSKGAFEQIIAYDVLEHIPNLTHAMTNCLDLLEPGGKFEIKVPYDLSYGAWQDPTHVRAFNERSWLYYTDWFWYMGWDEFRFKVDRFDLKVSPIGKLLHENGMDREEILRQPRAVDQMNVVLQKVALSEQDKRELAARCPERNG